MSYLLCDFWFLDVPAPWIVLEYLPHGDLKKFLMVHVIFIYVVISHMYLQTSFIL